MNLPVEIAGWKRVRKEGLPPYFRHRLLSELTYDNPTYTQLLKYNKRALFALIKEGNPPAKKLYFYREDPHWYYVPAHYSFGTPEIVTADHRVEPLAIYSPPLWDLRDIQTDAVETWEAKGRPSGMFVLPTGSGKTVLGLELARRTGLKAIVLSGRDENGVQMWVDDYKNYFGGVVGRIVAGKVKDMDSPVMVTTIQGLWRHQDLLAQLSRVFGVVIYDESQHLPANTFCETVSKFRAKYRFGVTATEKRTDGLQAMTFAVLGGMVFERRRAKEVAPVHVKIVRLSVPMSEVEERCAGNYSKAVKVMTLHDLRNAVLIDSIYRGGQGRYNLVVTHRVRHAKLLANLVVGRCGVPAEQVGILVANPNQQEAKLMPVTPLPGIETKQSLVKEKAKKGEIRWIFATYQYAGEGMDVPILDTLHMATPSKNEIEVTQALGRVRRAYPGKEYAQIYDYVDFVGMFHGFYMARCKIYRKLEEQSRAPETELPLSP